MQAMRIRKSISDSREITIQIPEDFSDNVEIIVLPLETVAETVELSEREFDFLTLTHALEDDESEDKVWQKYLTSGGTTK